MARVRRHELLGGGDHGGKSALHVGGAAAVEQPVADLRGKRVAAPLLERTRGHDVGVPGETQYRSLDSATRPEVLDVAETLRSTAKPAAASRSIRIGWQPSSAGVTERRAIRALVNSRACDTDSR